MASRTRNGFVASANLDVVKAQPGVRQAALIPERLPETVALAGDTTHQAQWKQKARDEFGLEIAVLSDIPLDKRHRSKVDYVELARRIGRRS